MGFLTIQKFLPDAQLTINKKRGKFTADTKFKKEGGIVPKVTIQVGKDFDPMLMTAFAFNVQLCVANALSCEEGKLEKHDVEVAITKVDPFHRIGYRDLQVIVIANDYPSRREILSKATSIIAGTVEYMRPSSAKTWSVWIRLVHGSYTDDASFVRSS